MKIIFAGTSSFAVPSLKKLIQVTQENPVYELIGIYTQPDRPCGRGQRVQASPIKVLAQTHQLPIYQPASLKELTVQNVFHTLKPDIIIVVAYGLLIPRAILKIPKFGCINVHASLLPRWRGAAPVQRACLAGDTKTGITIMQMEAGLDTGPILAQIELPILPEDTGLQLQTRLADVGASLLVDTLHVLPEKQSQAQPQLCAQACYAPKITKDEALIDWKEPADVIARKIQAFNPWPVAFTWLEGQRIRCWKAAVEMLDEDSKNYKPGQIVSSTPKGIVVATGKNYLCLLELQLEGGCCLKVSQLLTAKLAWVTENMQFSSFQ